MVIAKSELTARRSVRAVANTQTVVRLMQGDRLVATPLGHGYFRCPDGYVIAVTPSGACYMPNSLVVDVAYAADEPMVVGEGSASFKGVRVSVGPLWNSRPKVSISLRVDPSPLVRVEDLAGSGPGLTPAGDDLLVGYVAGLVLGGENEKEATEIVKFAMSKTTSLSATLLRHAVFGELPQPAHRLLESGDLEPLLRFGSTSGKAMIIGLALGLSRSQNPGGYSHWRTERIYSTVLGDLKSFDAEIGLPLPL